MNGPGQFRSNECFKTNVYALPNINDNTPIGFNQTDQYGHGMYCGPNTAYMR